jgi:hypothetical protein
MRSPARVILKAVRLMASHSVAEVGRGTDLFHGPQHDAGAGDPDVDDQFRFARPVESARDERIILNGIAECHEARTADRIVVARQVCRLLDQRAPFG